MYLVMHHVVGWTRGGGGGEEEEGEEEEGMELQVRIVLGEMEEEEEGEECGEEEGV